MTTIQVRAEHLTGEHVDADIEYARAFGGGISDRAAVTIASWWQAPCRTGEYLAALASGAPVDYEDLAEDMAKTRWLHWGELGESERRQLMYLDNWARRTRDMLEGSE